MSLFIENFFLDPDRYASATEPLYVDITDDTSAVASGSTYLMVDDVVVSGTTLSGITDGYRLYYNPPEDYLSDGPTVYTVHAENVISGTLEKDYTLLYGYDISFNEVIDWGANKQIDILALAKNKAYCSNMIAESFYFVTRDLEAHDLSSSILPTLPSNLSSIISTQAKAFYYGGTYQITVSGIKDNAGNKLAPITYSFTIENPIG